MDAAKFSELALRHREINNPLSPEALDWIIAKCDPPEGSRVLDLGCGKGEFLLRLVEGRAVEAVGIDSSEPSITFARARARDRRLRGTLRFCCENARSTNAAGGGYCVSVCLGATHALGGLGPTLRRLREWTLPGGWLVVGEGYWKRPPSKEYLDLLEASQDELLEDSGNIRMAEGMGLELVDRRLSSTEEWDAFEGAYLEGVESYAKESPDDPDVQAMIGRIRRWNRGYVRWGRETLGFGVYLFRSEP